MSTVSSQFNLRKTQSELDFVDVPVEEDVPLFLDPFALTLRSDRWSAQCAREVQDFFQLVVGHIRSGRVDLARSLLQHLGEPNETHLGLSSGRPQGAGIGTGQASALYAALAASTAVKTGLISHLEEAELMIPGVGRDKISDLTTNILRLPLVRYTQEQCRLHGISMTSRPLPPYFDSTLGRWKSDYFELPSTATGPLLLVPKGVVRIHLAYDHNRYYRDFVLDFLRAEELDAQSSLVHTLQDGRRRIFNKELEAKYPNSKEFLVQFSRKHPGILAEYREQLAKIESAIDSPFDETDAIAAAKLLIAALREVAPGAAGASVYHSLVIGVLELLFFPQLQHPVKEQEIHDGRKRIDILMENAARPGLALHDLHDIKKLDCPYVPIECKNYRTEVANPELDQLAGRFSTTRGTFGILCCRSFEDRALFVRRCRDTFQDGRGLIVPLDDSTMLRMLDLIAQGRRDRIDGVISDLIAEVWV